MADVSSGWPQSGHDITSLRSALFAARSGSEKPSTSVSDSEFTRMITCCQSAVHNHQARTNLRSAGQRPSVGATGIEPVTPCL
jgi:hypothetical protein